MRYILLGLEFFYYLTKVDIICKNDKHLSPILASNLVLI